MTSPFTRTVELEVNGAPFARTIHVRRHLADFLRHDLGLTGTHVGCEHGVCGACTVMIDGAPARSCITLAAACDGRAVRTIEGWGDDPVMAQLREAFSQEHALQCGYCTPGMLIAAQGLLNTNTHPTDLQIREAIGGNLCRCTGYQQIVNAVRSAAERLSAKAG